MTAPNHALAGALIGLAFGNPVLAVPIAFASHFAIDTVPHWDPPGDDLSRIRSKTFWYVQIVGGAVLCLAIVVLLALFRPQYWPVAALCAFVATTPDMFSLPKFFAAKQGKLQNSKLWLFRFHQTTLQWKTSPKLWWVELLWAFVYGGIFLACL